MRILPPLFVLLHPVVFLALAVMQVLAGAAGSDREVSSAKVPGDKWILS
jgi:hypothetical protein